MKISRKRLYIFIPLLVLLIGIGIVVYLSLPSQISAYLIDCVKTNTNGSCAAENALPKLTFRVYKFQGNVIEEHTGGIEEFNGCLIINVKNWQCTGSSGYFFTGFTTGDFFMKGGPASYANVTAVSEQQWLKYPTIAAPVVLTPPPEESSTTFFKLPKGATFIPNDLNISDFTFPGQPADPLGWLSNNQQ